MESKSAFPFILFPGMVTHTHRGLQAAESSSWNLPLNASKQGLRKQLITTSNGADCQGKQVFWTFLKQYLLLHSPFCSPLQTPNRVCSLHFCPAGSEHKTSCSSHQNFGIFIKTQTSNPRFFPFLGNCNFS